MKQPELGKKIAELRKEKGFTQEELVEACNINVRTIQRIEAGEVTPRTFTLKSILKALDYSLKDIKANLEAEISVSKKQIILLGFAFWLSVLMIPVDAYNVIYLINNSFKIKELDIFISPSLFTITSYLGLLCSFGFYAGFFVLGQIFKNTSLKIASILIFLLILIDFFTLRELFLTFSQSIVFAIIFIIPLGAVGIPLGIGILNLQNKLGSFAKETGIFTLILYGTLLTFILSPISILLYYPVLILQIILLYQAKEYLIDLIK